MLKLTRNAKEVFSPFSSNGEARGPSVSEAQRWGIELEFLLEALNADKFLTVNNFSDLANISNPEQGEVRWVTSDPNVSLRGYYKRVGTSWIRFIGGPQDVIQYATNVSGTNAITANIDAIGGLGILVVLTIANTNTTNAVTITFNPPGTARAIKTLSGEDPGVGKLQQGSTIIGLVSKDLNNFILISDKLDLQAVNNLVEALDTRLDAVELLNTTQNTRLTNVESVNSTQDTRLTNIESLNTTQNNRLTNIETLNTAQDNRLTNIESLNTTQNTRLTNVESVNSTQDTRLTNVESVNSTQDTRLTSVEGKVPIETPRGDLAWQVVDDNGKTLFGIRKSDSRLMAPGASGLYPLPLSDMLDPLGSDGWFNYYGSTDGFFMPKDTPSLKIYGVSTLGQSLAGGATDDPNAALLSTTPLHPGFALMPLTGLAGDGRGFDKFRDLIEESGGSTSGSRKETMASSFINKVITDCNSKFGFKPRLSFFMASNGSRSWPQHAPGQRVGNNLEQLGAFDQMAKALRGCVDAAKSINMSYEHAAVFYLGEQQARLDGATLSQIVAWYNNMARQVTACVMSITHQKRPPIIFISQPGNSTSDSGFIQDHIIACLRADGINNVKVLPPDYAYQTQQFESPPGTFTSGVHPTPVGYQYMGRIFARVFLEEVWGPGYNPLRIERNRWISTTQIQLTYSRAVQIDISGNIVTPPTWAGSLYGYQIFNASGTALPISTVTVSSDGQLVGTPDRIVTITLSSPRPGQGERLLYAMRNDGVGANAGPTTGARGCVREKTTSADPIWAHSEYLEL